jgi:hypothetical protein
VIFRHLLTVLNLLHCQELRKDCTPFELQHTPLYVCLQLGTYTIKQRKDKLAMALSNATLQIIPTDLQFISMYRTHL